MAEAAQNEGQGAPPPDQGGRPRNWWHLPLLIALLTLLTLRVPQDVLKGVIDDSWNATLVYAHVNHLHYGDDIVFTYGPLGYLVINHFLADTAVSRLLLGMVAGLSTISALCLLVWRMKPAWRVVWLTFFAVFCGVLHWAGDDLFMELALFGWGLLCLLESGRRLKVFILCLVGTAVLAALIKFTLAVVSGLALGTVACDLVLRRRTLLAAGMLGGFVSGWAVFWVLLGQDLLRIGVFLRHWLQIAGGYNQAMSLSEGNIPLGLLALVAAVIAVEVRVMTMPLPPAEHPRLRRGLLLAWLFAQFFLAWKYGYVRSDQVHLALFLVLVPMIALTLEALPSSGPGVKWVARSAALACGLVTMIVLYGFSPKFLLKAADWSCSNLTDNAKALLRADVYTQEKVALQNVEIQRMQLPQARAIIGRSTVDVFGQFGISAIFNEMNYHPRPIFQSYSAYSRPLMELNESFFLSTNAPEYVLFDLEAIDGRFPPVEDALALRAVLGNYALVGVDNMYLVLRHARNDPAALKLLREGDVQWNEPIGLTNYGGTNLWLELNVQPSVAGRARQFLYKPPEVQLDVWPATNSAVMQKFPVPVSMLAAGFLANPLELNTADVDQLYRGGSVTNAAAYALDGGPGGAWPWRPQIHYRIYAIENHFAGHGN